MTAANGASGTPGATDPQGQVPTTPSTNAAATGNPPASGQVPPTSASGDDLTPEQLRDALQKARADAAKERVDRKRLADLEKAEADRQAASLTDQQKIAQRAEAAEAALKSTRARIGASELKLAAQSAGIIDTDIAAALLGAKVEYDADGEPKNVADLVTQLKKDKPHLFGQQGQQQRPPATSGGATNPGRQAGNGGLTLEMIEAMHPRERVARIAEIDAWYKARQQQQR